MKGSLRLRLNAAAGPVLVAAASAGMTKDADVPDGPGRFRLEVPGG